MGTVIDIEHPGQVDGFYVYAHKRADDGKVFYIGKGKGKRAWVTRRRNPFWNNTAEKHGVVVEIIRSGLSCSESLKLEIEKIAEIGMKNLCNLTAGGDGASGYVMSDENRRLLSARLTGKKLSEQTRAKISKANAGKKRSRECVERHAEIIRGRKLSAEHIEKIKASNMGRTFSDETRKKISDALVGQKRSEQSRKKMAAARLGKARSEESKRKQSETMKAKTPEEVKKIKSGQIKSISCSNGMVFESLSDAAKWLFCNKGISHSKAAVSSCARGLRKSAYGFNWKYSEAA